MKDYIRYLRDEMRYFIKIILAVVSIIFLFAGLSHAEKVTFVKEYTYQASEIDSKVTARAIAVEQVKRLVLDELGTYLLAETEVKDFRLTKDKVVMLTAGIVQTEILNEKWDGERYYLKARIKADPNEVAAAVDRLRKDTQKSKELEDVKKKADEAFKEIGRLKKELDAVKADKNKQKEYAKAADMLSATDWFEKGLNFIELGNYSAALNAFTKAIELYPKFFGSYLNRGFAYDMLGNQQQAINDYNKAIELAPKLAKDADVFANVYVLRGSSYDELGNQQQAINDYNKAIELAPKLAAAYYGRGIVYNELGIYQQALSDLNKAIELDPQLAEVYFNRGITSHSLGNYLQAINDYNKAIELKPKLAEAYYNRGITYSRINNYQQAIEDFKIAARLGNKNAQDTLLKMGEKW
jgi:tetratricopeptide (TPR) repeat protein